MWFEDLTPYRYLRRPVTSSTRTLNVGWLERGHPFPSGPVPPAAITRLLDLVEHGPTNATRGMHFCDLCPSVDRDEPEVLHAPVASRLWGNAEVRAVAPDGTRYAAPTLIHHYVTAHGYRPPAEFVAALMRVADLAWTTARDADQCFACGSPMRRTRTFNAVQIGKGGRQEPVVSVWLECATCGTSYDRAWPA